MGLALPDLKAHSRNLMQFKISYTILWVCRLSSTGQFCKHCTPMSALGVFVIIVLGVFVILMQG